MGRDGSSTVTVNMDGSSKIKVLSQAKLDQLAEARARSLEVRRRNALAKVEGKVNHLRSMLGPDLKPDTVSRIAKEMIAVEERHEQEVERLRVKHTDATKELTETLAGCKGELQSIRKVLAAHNPVGHTTLKKIAAQGGPPSILSKAKTEASSQVSSRRA